MKVEYWPHRGAYEDSKKEKQCFDSLNATLEYVINLNSDLGSPAFSKEDLYVRHYAHDPHVQNERFALCTGRYYNENFIEKYKSPMCIGFLYFDKERVKDRLGLSDGIIHKHISEHISALELKDFFVDNFDVFEQNIEIVGNYCRLVFLDTNSKNEYIQPRSKSINLGAAIKEVRIRRNMTQKALGLALGFKDSSADIRVAQYESGKRTPKSELLEKIENVLNCKFNSVNYVEYSLLELNQED